MSDADAPRLAKQLSLFDLTMIAIGSSIGSGIFLTPSSIAESLPTPFGILAVWGAGGLMTLAGALTFAELGVLLPGGGGIYLYLTEAYGRMTGFLYGWAYFTVVTTGALAALALAFAKYVSVLFPMGDAATKIVALGGLAAVTVVNVLGVKIGALFSDVFTVLKLLAIAGVVTLGIALGTGASDYGASLPSGGIVSGAAAAMVGVLWSYGGWQHASFGAAEAKRPARDVPIAMVVGTFSVTLVYVLVNVAYMRLLSPARMAASSEVAAEAIDVALGRAGGAAIAVAIVVSTLGTVGIYTLTAPRMYLAMAERGLFFRGATTIDPRFRTPARAIVLQSVWAAVLVLFWGTFDKLISYVVFVDWIFFGLTGAAVFVLRRKHPEWARPYKTIGYPLTPFVFVAMSAAFVVGALVHRPAQALGGAILMTVGVGVFFLWDRRNRATA
jgi:APA family basic amino acid/polyamine antiporter